MATQIFFWGGGVEIVFPLLTGISLCYSEIGNLGLKNNEHSELYSSYIYLYSVYISQELLKLQYEGVSVTDMFGKAKINVNLLLHFLNAKFYGK